MTEFPLKWLAFALAKQAAANPEPTALIIIAVCIVLYIFLWEPEPFLDPDEYKPLPIIKIIPISEDKRKYVFKFPDWRMRLGLPPGCHVTWKAMDDMDKELVRAYVPSSDYFKRGTVEFTIKFIPDGKMSWVISKLEVGDSMLMLGAHESSSDRFRQGLREIENGKDHLASCHVVSKRVGEYTRKLVTESDTLNVEVTSLQYQIGVARVGAAELPPEHKDYAFELLAEADAVLTGQGPGGDLRRFGKPPWKYPFLLRGLLGSQLPAVTLHKEQAVGIRMDYQAFRSRGVWVLFVVPLMLYLGMRRADSLAEGEEHQQSVTLTPAVLTGLQCYLAWLMYFYVGLALRESVLQLNGSHIRPWWITHHYCSALASLILLAMPITSPSVNHFAEQFMLLSCFQAVVMLLQNLYQRRRMYTRIALGKNSTMDVVSGESSGSAGQLLLLYPLLFAFQGWQLLLGLSVMSKTWPAVMAEEGWLEQEPSESDLRGMRGTFVSGCLFAYMAMMNFKNTLGTIREKQRYRRQRRAVGMSDAKARSVAAVEEARRIAAEEAAAAERARKASLTPFFNDEIGFGVQGFELGLLEEELEEEMLQDEEEEEAGAEAVVQADPMEGKGIDQEWSDGELEEGHYEYQQEQQ